MILRGGMKLIEETKARIESELEVKTYIQNGFAVMEKIKFIFPRRKDV